MAATSSTVVAFATVLEVAATVVLVEQAVTVKMKRTVDLTTHILDSGEQLQLR
jgi:hypothetical protein